MNDIQCCPQEVLVLKDQLTGPSLSLSLHLKSLYLSLDNKVLENCPGLHIL